MTREIEDGGPAFPNTWDETNEYGVIFPFVERGMSLRDYFAGQALAGTLAGAKTFGPFKDADDIALRSYRMADAMLAARATRST